MLSALKDAGALYLPAYPWAGARAGADTGRERGTEAEAEAEADAAKEAALPLATGRDAAGRAGWRVGWRQARTRDRRPSPALRGRPVAPCPPARPPAIEAPSAADSRQPPSAGRGRGKGEGVGGARLLACLAAT